MPHDAFISHSSSDKELANQLIAVLEKHDVRCWAAMRDALYGPTYAKQIVEAIRTCRLMVLLFSTAANDSPHIMREVERAVDLRVPLITVRINNISPNDDLDYFLRVCHWMDAYNGPFDAHAEKLANQVRQMLQTPAGSAPAPSAPPPRAVVPMSMKTGAPPQAAAVPTSTDAAPASAASAPDQPTMVVKPSPIAKLAAAAVLAVGIAAAAIFALPRSAQSGWPPADHYLQREEVKAQIVAEMHDGLSAIPITRLQFASYAHALETDAEKQHLPLTWRDPGFHQNDDGAAVCVSYQDAKGFCDWLKDFRLPTDDQWQKAAGKNPDMTGKIWQWVDDSAATDAAKSLRGGTKQTDQKLSLPAAASMSNVGFRVAAGG